MPRPYDRNVYIYFLALTISGADTLIVSNPLSMYSTFSKEVLALGKRNIFLDITNQCIITFFAPIHVQKNIIAIETSGHIMINFLTK